MLSSDADIIIIDPERDYSQLVRAMGGEVIHISATSQSHYLAELLKDENNSLWSAVLYGISYSDGEIVTVALS